MIDTTLALKVFDDFLLLMDDQIDALKSEALRQGSVLDFSLPSLDALETIFLTKTIAMSKEQVSKAIVYFARYLGETVIFNHGGRWVLSLSDEKNVNFNLPVIVGHSKVPGLEFSPVLGMRALSLRKRSGLLRQAVAAQVNPTPVDISNLIEK